MKKLYFICLLVFLAFSTSASADDGKLGKTLQKECKKQVKKLNKEGWTVWGKTQSVESALEAHYLKMQESGIDAVMIESNSTAKTANMAIRRATINAQVQYSSMKKSEVSATNHIKISTTNGEEGENGTQFSSNSVSQTGAVIKGFNPTATFCRKTKDGIYEVLVLFIVKD